MQIISVWIICSHINSIDGVASPGLGRRQLKFDLNSRWDKYLSHWSNGRILAVPLEITAYEANYFKRRIRQAKLKANAASAPHPFHILKTITLWLPQSKTAKLMYRATKTSYFLLPNGAQRSRSFKWSKQLGQHELSSKNCDLTSCLNMDIES